MGKDLGIPVYLEDLVHNILFSNALPVSFSKPKGGKRSIETEIQELVKAEAVIPAPPPPPPPQSVNE
jgi:hypothetical protein